MRRGLGGRVALPPGMSHGKAYVMRRSADPRQHARARELRRNVGVSERVLWTWLRKDRLGARFRRQVPVGPYILDFFCLAARLCVEMEGEHHAVQRECDSPRDAYLAEQGVLTLQVSSLALFSDDPKVDPVREIAVVVERRLSERGNSTPPLPPHSLWKRGGGLSL